MASGTFYPAVSGDDGYWISGVTDASFAYPNLLIGNQNDNICRASIRFPNVTIPQGSTITSCFIRLTADDNNSANVDVDIYANDVDDAVAPTGYISGDALVLTTASANWTPSAWVTSNAYDSASLIAVMQEVVDRGGFASGNAVQFVIVDNGSGSGGYYIRSAYTYDYDSGSEKAELHVEWSEDVDVECTTAELSITTNSAIVHVDLDITCSTATLSITANSATVLYGAVVNCTPAVLTLTANAANISYDLNISCTPAALTVSAQSATISYDINVSAITTALSLTTHNAVVWDGAAWSAWISANGDKLSYLYYCTLTGADDGETDLTIPMTSWQARRKDGEPTFLSVVTPYSPTRKTAIEARTSGTIQVSMAYLLDGVEQYREVICQADYEEMRIDRGGRSQSITLTGHKTESFTPKTIALRNVISETDDDGDLRYRCATADLYLNPGDTATYGANSFIVAQIVYAVSTEGQSMDVNEAEI